MERVGYPLDPDYANILYRRRVRLVGSPGRVDAGVEDCYHGMRCTVIHDGHTVTDLYGDLPRTPLTTCVGAAAQIAELIGTPIDLPPRDISRNAEPSRNCTHLFDLALLAIAHARRGALTRQYDVTITPEIDQPATATVHRDGLLIHTWQVRRSEFTAPAELAGRPVLKGFLAWASDRYDDDTLEAARVLQKGYFVARALRYNLIAMEGKPVAEETSMLGSCHSFSPEVVGMAFRREDAVRNFTDVPEQLLRFI